MFGKFQQSLLRIEIEASELLIFDALTKKELLEKWLPIHYFSSGLPSRLSPGTSFTTGVGVVTLSHQVEVVNHNSLRLLLAGAIDGYHEWYWGEGWLQSKLEGVSLLPIGLGVTGSLLSLRELLKRESAAAATIS